VGPPLHACADGAVGKNNEKDRSTTKKARQFETPFRFPLLFLVAILFASPSEHCWLRRLVLIFMTVPTGSSSVKVVVPTGSSSV